MTQSIFEVGADGVDVGAIVEDIRAAVAKKTEEGLYADARIARAEKANLRNLKGGDSFMDLYLECLRDAVIVDINDFQIQERRALFGGAYVVLKHAIWKMLKFYTYRLWSQQNETNAMLLSATEAVDNKYREKMRELEARIAELEKSR